MNYSLRLSSRADNIRRAVKAIVPPSLYLIAAEEANAFWGAVRVGYSQYRALRAMYPDRTHLKTTPVRCLLPRLEHPIWVRPGTTDAQEVVYSIIREAYAALLPSPPVRVIVDAGANIGDTTAWFLTKFPKATVIALEPETDNYQLLVKNCGPYGPRALLLNAALWPVSTQLAVMPSTAADAHTVSETIPPGETACLGMPMPDVVKLVDSNLNGEIDIFKCDIEGAETAVFLHDSDRWLPRVRCMIVEVHGSEAYTVVMDASRRHGFGHRVYRNLHFFWRSQSPKAWQPSSRTACNGAEN